MTTTTYTILLNNKSYNYPYFILVDDKSQVVPDPIVFYKDTTYTIKNNSGEKIMIGTQYGHNHTDKKISPTDNTFTINGNDIQGDYLVIWIDDHKYMQRPISVQKTSTLNPQPHKEQRIMSIDGVFYIIEKSKTDSLIDSKFVKNSSLQNFPSSHTKTKYVHGSLNTASTNSCSSTQSTPATITATYNYQSQLGDINLGTTDSMFNPLAVLSDQNIRYIDQFEIPLSAAHINSQLYLILVDLTYSTRIFVYNNKYEIYKYHASTKCWKREDSSPLTSPFVTFTQTSNSISIKLSCEFSRYNNYAIELFIFNSKKHVTIDKNKNGRLLTTIFENTPNNIPELDTDMDNNYNVYAYINDIVSVLYSDKDKNLDKKESDSTYTNYFKDNKYVILNYSLETEFLNI